MRTPTRIALLLFLMIFVIAISGCSSIGVKEKVRIIYVGYSTLPEEANGALRIATNEKIPVTVVGKDDVHTKLDVGGYFVISKNDLMYFLKEKK